MRRADEHLHKIVVQGVVELALEAPLKLRVVEIAWVQIKIVGVHRNAFILELDNNLNPFIFRTCRKNQEWMLVQPKLR